MKEAPTAQQLAELLNSTTASPDDKAWNIYRYMTANLPGNDKTASTQTLTSDGARNLMMTYLKLGTGRPSMLHSQMLGVALKMTEAFEDFRLPGFLKVWDLNNLRSEDLQPYRAADGRTFRALAQKLATAIIKYGVKHPDDQFEPQIAEWAAKLSADCGYLPMRDMVAVKVFETERDRRKMRMVKLVGADGCELSADWHIFNTKPWEIAGKMYTVLPRLSEKSGNVRVDTIAPSASDISGVFGRVIGYVDRYDSKHKQYHIFDNQSRHFVAEAPKVRISEGEFVWFAPVIPAEDKFKTAIVIAPETQDAGIEAFGITEGKVAFVDKAKGYFAFNTADGVRGSANLSIVNRPLTIGHPLKLIAFLRRGKDGEKRLHAVIAI